MHSCVWCSAQCRLPPAAEAPGITLQLARERPEQFGRNVRGPPSAVVDQLPRAVLMQILVDMLAISRACYLYPCVLKAARNTIASCAKAEVRFMEEQDPTSETSTPAINCARIDEYAYLIGAAPIREFVEFVRARSLQGVGPEEDQLIANWGRAASHIRELEATEGGFADNAEIIPLPDALAALAQRELQDPCVRRSLGHLPYKWALVDLDRVIVHQRSLDRASIRCLADAFPAAPTDEELFSLASGRLRPPPPIRVTRASEYVYTFASPSSDLRFLDLTLLNPQSVQGYHPPGRPAAVVAVAVGYGINFTAVFRIQGRLILHNGTHRATMAYERGIRKFPCLVREVSNDDDLDLVGAGDVKQNLHLYLRSRRPPRLRDFSNPRLHTIIPVAAASRLVHVQINTQRSRVSVPENWNDTT
jgi:hypothetical protein